MPVCICICHLSRSSVAPLSCANGRRRLVFKRIIVFPTLKLPQLQHRCQENLTFPFCSHRRMLCPALHIIHPVSFILLPLRAALTYCSVRQVESRSDACISAIIRAGFVWELGFFLSNTKLVLRALV